MEETNKEILNELEERKKKIFHSLKKTNFWILGFLVIALVLGVYIRSMPMQDHGGLPGLWDVAKNNWTLGPDLDPWLFTRIAKETIETGSFPKMDLMRNVPFGFDNSQETILLPYLIVWTYKFVNMFGSYNVEFAAALLPVIMFFLTIISFFLFVKEVFTSNNPENKTKASIIALISTFFMIVIPVFLSRTVAGIPEKESGAFFFMFLAFYFFIKAWKQEKVKNALIFGILAGAATTGMGMITGLFSYIYVTIAIAGLVGFVLNKFHKIELIVYSSWWTSAAILLTFLPGKVDFMDLLTSLTIAPAFFVLVLIFVHLGLWETRISKNEYLRKINLPKNIVSILIAIIVGLILISIIHPSIIVEKIKVINNMFFRPVSGRWNTTVAENQQPYFKEWVKSFGPNVKNIPILFWMMFMGSVVLFYQMLNKIKRFDAIILTILYAFFFSGLVFSRYASNSLFSGENFISKVYYIGSLLLFLGYGIYYYLQYYKEGHTGFEKVDFNLIFLFVLFIAVIFTVRGAVRLIMVLGPIAPIFLSYLMVNGVYAFFKAKEEDNKIIYGIIMILLLIVGVFTFWSFYGSIKVQAYSAVPYYYSHQWQYAMEWVRTNTSTESVFGHWWDYGYWVQSIGERATVLDGGNAISFWNYWMGRLVLTGDNQQDALDFLYAHNTTHLLIDSSDIEKYGAFSQIGSDADYDRRSWIGNYILDEKQTQESQNKTVYVYTGGTALDEDLIINQNGKEIFLPKERSAVGGILVPFAGGSNNIIEQPTIAIFDSGGNRHDVLARYVYLNGKFLDFKTGINATVFIYPYISQSGGKMSQNNIGTAMFLSPRLMRGMLAQKYILNDPFNKWTNLKLVHSETDTIIAGLNSQGASLPEFVYYGGGAGLLGPIKIWEIEYTGKETVQEKYLDRDSSKYLSWKL